MLYIRTQQELLLFRLFPTGLLKLTSVANLGEKKIVTFTWHSNDMFHYVLKAEFVALVGLKVPSGCQG